MDKFYKRLNEFIEEHSIIVPKMAIELGYKYKSPLYRLINGQGYPRLDKAIKLADYFNCSLDYLFGLSDDNSQNNFKQPRPFDEQLRKVLKEKGVHQNQLIVDGKFSANCMHNWFKLKANPQMDTVIRLAEYLGESLDYLVGRV